MPVFPDPFTDFLQGVVPASGSLTLTFGPPLNQKWEVEQVTVEMPTAPAGASVDLRKMGQLYAPSYSARRAVASGPPPLFLHGGETATVEWSLCTPGDIGKVTFVYRKTSY